MPKCYKGREGALRLIANLAWDYDGYLSQKGLMSLIDEIRMISLLALREGEEFELKKGEGK